MHPSRRAELPLSGFFLLVLLTGCGAGGLPIAQQPTFAPAPGTYSSPQSVTLSDSSPDATIFYTTDGSTPTAASNRYSGPIALASTTTIDVTAVIPGYANSPVLSATYTIALAATALPTFSPPAGNYSSPQSVQIADSTPNASIFYTTDGSTPTTSSTPYTAPIPVTGNQTIEAVATAPGFAPSPVATAAYTIVPVPQAAAPTFNPPSGTYATPPSVQIADSTPGATIFYTTDGSDPTPASASYTTPLLISANTTLKAIATAPAYTVSQVAAATYIIGAAPSGKGQWTWMGGTDASFAPPVFGTPGVASSANTPGSRDRAATFTGKDGTFYLFGGSAEDANTYLLGYRNDLWQYNPASAAGSANWAWIDGSQAINPPGSFGTQGVASPANQPPPRAGATSWTAADGSLWLFGGSYQTSAQVDMGDLWQFNPATNLWTWRGGSTQFSAPAVYGTLGVPAPSNYPGARSDSPGCTDHAGNLYLFGGYSQQAGFGQNGYLNDLWQFNPATNLWTWLSGSNQYNQFGVYGSLGTPAAANTPGARIAHNCWTDNSGNIWIFGGIGYDSTPNNQGYMELNDLWEFNTTTHLWSWMAGSNTSNAVGNFGTLGVPDPANVPASRDNAAAWTDAQGDLWLFGGAAYNPARGGAPTIINDLWRFHIATSQWTWMSGANTFEQLATYGQLGVPDPQNVPGARDENTTWVDAQGNLWLFGGFGYSDNYNSGFLSDLWRYQP